MSSPSANYVLEEAVGLLREAQQALEICLIEDVMTFSSEQAAIACLTRIRNWLTEDGQHKNNNIPFSRREIEVLLSAARGETYDEISKRLAITKDTAKAHMEAARTKVGGLNKTHAIALAISRGYFRL